MSTDVMTNQKTTTKEKKRISTKVIAPIFDSLRKINSL